MHVHADTKEETIAATKQQSDSHSLIAELDRKFVLEEDGKGSTIVLDEGHSMRTPLCMLGGMVSPHLRKAQVIVCLNHAVHVRCDEPGLHRHLCLHAGGFHGRDLGCCGSRKCTDNCPGSSSEVCEAERGTDEQACCQAQLRMSVLT